MAKRKQIPRGRKTELTAAVIIEICDKVANSASFQDACILSGVRVDTALNWRQKGAEVIHRGEPETEAEGLYVQFVRAIEEAKSRHRMMLKLLIARAARGTDKKPGDWRAAQALGAMTNPKEFVPQLRVHVERELDGVLDALAEAFKDEPKHYERALQAVVSRSMAKSDTEDEP